MKRIALVALAGIFAATPVLANHHEEKMDTKDEVRQCALEAETLQKKMKRIQGEIKKGSKKYTAEELKQLNDKLKEANELMDSISKQ